MHLTEFIFFSAAIAMTVPIYSYASTSNYFSLREKKSSGHDFTNVAKIEKAAVQIYSASLFSSCTTLLR
jgi:hypothetical protein